MSRMSEQTMEPGMTEVLTELLRQAAEAHGRYEAEELGGVYDNEWPEWYASHMARTLTEQGYRLTRSSSS